MENCAIKKTGQTKAALCLSCCSKELRRPVARRRGAGRAPKARAPGNSLPSKPPKKRSKPANFVTPYVALCFEEVQKQVGRQVQANCTKLLASQPCAKNVRKSHTKRNITWRPPKDLAERGGPLE